MLFVMAAWPGLGGVNIARAESDVPKPAALLCAPAPAAATVPWCDFGI